MPKINIKENDLTTAGGLSLSSNVVYVPGFVAYINQDNVPTTGFPHLFKTVNEFTSVFSNKNGDFKYVRTSVDDTTTGYRTIQIEKGTQYALTLLNLGLPVLFDPLNESSTINKETYGVSDDTIDYTGADSDKKPTDEVLKTKASSLISDKIKNLKNRNLYDIKFITTGGYENYSTTMVDEEGKSVTLAQAIINISKSRGDCTALIDHEELTTVWGISKSTYTKPTFTDGKFGAMFTPWCNFQLPSFEKFQKENDRVVKLSPINMPGSFAYLMAYANSIFNNNASWLAVAGATRGNIPYLIKPLVELTEAHIDAYSLYNDNYIGIAVNPIANINPYGTIIWGNRTLHNGTTGLIASSFLNIRQLCNDIKKNLYAACKGITFEQNSDILWVKFKSLITPLLDRMQTGEGISGYELKKKKSAGKATLTAVLRIYPIEAVENFEITLELADEATNTTDSL